MFWWRNDGKIFYLKLLINVFFLINFLLLQSKTYDSVTEKYLDFSFEKTNSAYMLFYERRLPEHLKEKHAHLLASPNSSSTTAITKPLNLEEKANAKDKDNDNEKQEIKPDKKDTNNDENNSKMEVDIDDNNDNKLETANCDNKTNENETDKSKEKQVEKAEEMDVEKEKEKDKDKDNIQEKEIDLEKKKERETETPSTSMGTSTKQIENPWRPQLSKELEDWIWQDNRQFLQDRNIFEHTYFK